MNIVEIEIVNVNKKISNYFFSILKNEGKIKVNQSKVHKNMSLYLKTQFNIFIAFIYLLQERTHNPPLFSGQSPIK